jgi:hypothetical protein
MQLGEQLIEVKEKKTEGRVVESASCLPIILSHYPGQIQASNNDSINQNNIESKH